MRKFWIFLFGLIVILSATGQQRKFDSIVAMVNDEPITYREVYEKIKTALDEIEKRDGNENQKEKLKNQILNAALREMVEERLIFQEAKRHNIKIPEKTIRKEVEKLLERQGGQEEGLDLTELMRKRLTVQELFQKKATYSQTGQRRATIDTYVSPSELRHYYLNNASQFVKEGKIKTRSIILIYIKHGGKEQTIAKARSIVNELRKGADFATMARDYDNGPNREDGGSWPRIEKDGKLIWDFFARGNSGLYKEAEDIAFAMEKGEVSAPIALDSYCLIIKVEDVQAGGTTSFVEAQQFIRNVLRQRKTVAALKRIKEKLKQKAYIWPPNLFKGS